MISALRTAANGLIVQSAKQDIIANNIANAQTSGFKRVRTASTSFAQTLQQAVTPSTLELMPSYPQSPASPTTVSLDEAVDTSQGPIHSTDNDLDIAISGPGSFQTNSTSGTQFTRSGSFHPGPNGELLTMDGASVMGQSGTIKLPNGKVEIKEDGTILVDGSNVDKIKIIGEQPGTTQLLQGHLEDANVSIISEMVSMIGNMRAFEANQKVIASVDRTLETLISQVGRV